MGRGTTPLPLVYFVTLHGCYIQIAIFFLILPNGSPKIGTIVVPKLWTLISSPNQAFLEHARAISYSPQKYFSKGVFHAPIRKHLTLVLRGFVVGSRIFNLTPNLFLDHHSCILSLNEQYEGTLGIYISKKIKWYLGGLNLVLVFLFNQGFEHLRLLHKCNF